MSEDAIPRVETERLLLRAFDESDAEAVTFYADAEVMRYIPRGPWLREEVETRFGRMLDIVRDRWRDNGYGMWAVVLKGSGAVIGHCGLQRLDGGDEIEVFYLLDKPHWNRGIATEAAAAALAFARERELGDIVAVAFPENRASQRVMEKAGMTLVGRAHHFGAELVKYIDRASGPRRAESRSADGNQRS